MTIRLGILSLLLGLLTAAPTDYARACGQQEASYAGRSVQHRKSCCGTTEKSAANHHGCHCKKDRPGQPCSGNGDGRCHCPGIGGGISAVMNGLLPGLNVLPMPTRMTRQAFYFAGRQPEDVYFPVWQPPKLAA